MLEATLSNGLVVQIDEELRYFLNGQERGVWFDAITGDSLTHPADRIKFKINSNQVVAIREINV